MNPSLYSKASVLLLGSSCSLWMSAIKAFAPCKGGTARRLWHRRWSASNGRSESSGEEFINEFNKRIHSGQIPESPFDKQPSKSDFYGDGELANLLNLHTNLQSTTFADTNDGPIPPSLHDMVMEAVQDIDESPSYVIDDSTRTKLSNIRMIASDVDGTLLSSSHTLHPTTKAAVEAAVGAAFSPVHPLQYMIPATGKSRAGALGSLGDEIGSLLGQVPGVFIQGLYCVDAAGNVIFEQRLERTPTLQAEAIALEYSTSLFAYDGDTILATDSSRPEHIHDVNAKWGEPVPTVVETLQNYGPVHKVLLMDDDVEKLDTVVRPRLEAMAAEWGCTVTKAVPTMLELLPPNCSKANGLAKLCEALGIDPSTELMAIGDQENDVGMLEMAAFGVAVGNGVDAAKAAADFVMKETNDEGGAGVAIELFGLGQILKE